MGTRVHASHAHSSRDFTISSSATRSRTTPHCQPSARIAWSKDAGSAPRLATRNAETSASLAPSAGQAHLIAPVRTVAANTVQHSKHQDTYWRRPPCICAERVESHSFPPRCCCLRADEEFQVFPRLTPVGWYMYENATSVVTLGPSASRARAWAPRWLTPATHRTYASRPSLV